MSRTLTVASKGAPGPRSGEAPRRVLARRVAQVRAGQTTIEEAPTTLEAIPVAEQLAQIDALMASQTPEEYSYVIAESGWRALAEVELVRLELECQERQGLVILGQTAIAERGTRVPQSWLDRLAVLENEFYLADTRYRAKLSQYQRQLRRAS